MSRRCATSRFAVLLACAAACAAIPATAHAQRVRSEGGAFAVEGAGATVGSFVGAAAAYQLLNATRGACGAEDLSCLLGRLGGMGIASAAGAAGGGYFAGRAAETRPSGWGSILGAVVGVGAGAAAAKGLDELGARGRWAQAIGYTLTQGLLTAAGSRALARRR